MSNVELHAVETSTDWTDDELDKMIVFCILDRAMPYFKVTKVWEALDESGMTTRKEIQEWEVEDISKVLKSVGHRFPNQAAVFIKEFGDNPIDLRTATRQELVDNIKGIGMKLASMFLVRTRGYEFAILDVHIKNWLKERGRVSNNYTELEEMFFEEADKLGVSPNDLDLLIWDERRLKQ